MDLRKYCNCCSTEEDLLQGCGHELKLLPVMRFKKGGAFWGCDRCDGDLVKLAMRQPPLGERNE